MSPPFSSFCSRVADVGLDPPGKWVMRRCVQGIFPGRLQQDIQEMSPVSPGFGYSIQVTSRELELSDGAPCKGIYKKIRITEYSMGRSVQVFIGDNLI